MYHRMTLPHLISSLRESGDTASSQLLFSHLDRCKISHLLSLLSRDNGSDSIVSGDSKVNRSPHLGEKKITYHQSSASARSRTAADCSTSLFLGPGKPRLESKEPEWRSRLKTWCSQVKLQKAKTRYHCELRWVQFLSEGMEKANSLIPHSVEKLFPCEPLSLTFGHEQTFARSSSSSTCSCQLATSLSFSIKYSSCGKVGASLPCHNDSPWRGALIHPPEG